MSVSLPQMEDHAGGRRTTSAVMTCKLQAYNQKEASDQMSSWHCQPTWRTGLQYALVKRAERCRLPPLARSSRDDLTPLLGRTTGDQVARAVGGSPGAR